MERRTFIRASALSAGGLVATPVVATAASPLRVQVLMFDGVEEQDLIAPVEVFGLAEQMGGAVRSTLVTTGRPGTVTCAYGTRMEVPRGWSPRDADVLVVPGGGYTDRNGPGVHRLISDQGFLRRLAGSPALPVGICTGVMVLSAAGLTRGRPATTHAGAKADLAAQGATVVHARVVDDDTLVTGGGVTAGLEVSLWLVERFLGAKFTNRVETVLEYERRGTVWRA
ncbi:DJ-1/PfpI family protein [Saccharothrix algeriensis]|uniref:DJ-1/PfpI family protein n=1 Tax=Saccharothrix algeriensis TaxID=173560 RepID=A0A8T8HW88_9PSEU|nr:DJ-1/PfpI family protein [Saccharothrix algeriensis]MBM7814295.1 transcriptional regulator GlxA family with amidase domain [Saccharothrix algeriensis]QTR02639.1 DJ-1/PfpI family protein [Saccharothrix algeriensis]